MAGEGNEAAIAEAATRCQNNFLQALDKLPGTLEAFEQVYIRADLQDDYEQFRVFARNVGAFARDDASLDFRLREASVVQQAIINALNGISHNLEKCVALAEAKDGDERDVPEEQSSSSESSSSEESDEAALPPASYECRARLQDVSQLIENLVNIAVRIRKSGSSSRASRALNYERWEDGVNLTAHFEDEFIPRILSRENVEEPLRSRLITAIASRRRRFEYAKAHQQKLSYGLDRKTQPNVPFHTTESTAINKLAPQGPASAAAAPSLDQPRRSLEPEPSLRPPSTKASKFDPASLDTMSNTSIQRKSVASSKTHKKLMNIPGPPKAFQRGKHFECPYCCILLSPEKIGETLWKKHVISDLRPYVCLHPECETPDKEFATENEWYEHHKWQHALYWWCDGDQGRHTPQSFSNRHDFESHISSKHSSMQLNENQLQMLSKISAKPSQHVFDGCPFCDFQPASSFAPMDGVSVIGGANIGSAAAQEQLRSHILTEILELFLHALPDRDDILEHDSATRSAGLDRSTLAELEDVTITKGEQNFEEVATDEDASDVIVHYASAPADDSWFVFYEEWARNEKNSAHDPENDSVLQDMLEARTREQFAAAGEVPKRHDSPFENMGDISPLPPPENETEDDIQSFKAPLGYEYVAQRRRRTELLRSRQDDTCGWILWDTQVIDWLADKDEPSALVLSGPLGCGKSVVAAFLFDCVRKLARDKLVAEYYCNRESTSRSILEALLYQLLSETPDLLEALTNETRLSLRHGRAGTEKDLWASLLSIFERARPREIFLLIDEADACEIGSYALIQESLQNYFFRPVTDTIGAEVLPKLHVLFTTRPEFLGSRAGLPCAFLDILPPLHLKGDVSKFISHQLEAQRREGRLVHGGLEEALNRWAEGDFLRARMYLNIHRATDIGFWNALGNREEPDLPRLFEDAISQGSSRLSTARVFAYRIVLSGYRPLDSRAFCTCLSLIENVNKGRDYEWIRTDERVLHDISIERISAGLLETVRYGGNLEVVQTSHRRVQEYLLDLSTGFVFNKGESHALMAAACLQYMLFPETEIPTPTNMVVPYSFLDYALSFWSFHLGGASQFAWQDNLGILVSRFVNTQSEKFLAWLKLDYGFFMPWRYSYDATCPSKEMILHAIAYWGLEKLVRAATIAGQSNGEILIEPIDLRVQVDSSNPHGESPLFIAAARGNYITIWRFIVHGAKLDLLNGDGAATALHAAAQRGYERSVDHLVSSGANVNLKDAAGFTPALRAAVNGHWDIALRLFKCGADVNSFTPTEESALYYAILHGRVDLVDTLIEAGADPTQAAPAGNSLVHLAAAQGHGNLLEVLARGGADVNATRIQDRSTPLHLAVREARSLSTVQSLLSLGAELEAVDAASETALDLAVTYGVPEVVQELLNSGAYPDFSTDSGATLLHIAAEENWPSIIELLASSSLIIDPRDDQGRTPLMLSVARKNREAAAKLLELGAKVSIGDIYGRTPLHFLLEARDNFDAELCNLVLDAGAQPLERGDHRFAPIELAVLSGDPELVEMLLTHVLKKDGPDTSASLGIERALESISDALYADKTYFRGRVLSNCDLPLVAIAGSNRKEVVRLLLEYGANPSLPNRYGSYAIHKAAWNGNLDTLELLILNNADLNAQEARGKTALSCAIEEEERAPIELLLNAGADPSISNSTGTAPCHCAAPTGDLAVLELLIRSRANIDAQTLRGWTPLSYAALHRQRSAFNLLLEAGANPYLQTVHGRGAFDWAYRNADVFRPVRAFQSYTAPSQYKSNTATLIKSEAEEIIRAIGQGRDPNLEVHELAFDLMLRKDWLLAGSMLEVVLRFLSRCYDHEIFRGKCSMCKLWLKEGETGVHFCKHCIVVVLCDECLRKNYDKDRPTDDPVCNGHEFLSIRRGWNGPPVSDAEIVRRVQDVAAAYRLT